MTITSSNLLLLLLLILIGGVEGLTIAIQPSISAIAHLIPIEVVAAALPILITVMIVAAVVIVPVTTATTLIIVREDGHSPMASFVVEQVYVSEHLLCDVLLQVCILRCAPPVKFVQDALCELLRQLDALILSVLEELEHCVELLEL